MKEGYFEHSMSLSKLTLSGREGWDVETNLDNATKFAGFLGFPNEVLSDFRGEDGVQKC